MNFDDTPEEAAFRAEVQAFLAANAKPKAGDETDWSRNGASTDHAVAEDYRRRCREWQRPLRVVHVVSPMDTGGLSFLPRPAEEGARQARFQAQRAEVERWAEELGLAEGLELELDVRAGSAIDELLAISRLGSPLVVCGARRLSWLERHLKASHATTLSSHAPVPVAVVPPEADAPESNR